jgi:hypothetical protein
VVVAVTALAIVVFSVPSSFEYYRGVCTLASEVCSERAVNQATQKASGATGRRAVVALLRASERRPG